MSNSKAQSLGPATYNLDPKNMGAMDIETRGFSGGFIIAKVKHWDGSEKYCHTPEETLAFILDTPKDASRRHTSGTIYAHNGGGFDFAYLAEAARDYCIAHPEIEASIIPQGKQKFIGIKFQNRRTKRGHTVTLSDSMAVCPGSLKKMAEAFAPHMPKMDHCPDHCFERKCDKGHVEGWFSKECERCMLYLDRDVDSLLASMKGLEAKLHEVFQAPIGITNGAIAVKAARVTMDGWYFRMKPEYEEFVRPAVHGGFVWSGFKRGSRGRAKTFDRSGAYGYQLTQGLPHGKETFAGDLYDDTVPGIWDCTVWVPEDIPIPILCGPLGGYPTGTFRHRFTNIELEYAQKLGCQIVQVHEGLVWERYVYPFNEFIERCQSLEYPKHGEADPAVKGTVKLLRNALPGKFATRPTVDKFILASETPEEEGWSNNLVDGMMTCVWVKEGDEIDGAGYIMPHWNAFITARQRIDIHKILMAAGEYAYYSDTDSITLESTIADLLVGDGTIDEGKVYGKYHVECGDKDEEWDDFVVVGPKNKLGRVADKWFPYAKGVPQDVRDVDIHLKAAQGIAEDSVEWESPTSFRMAILNPDSPPARNFNRRYSILENSTNWKVDSEHNIRPKSYEEQCAA